MGIFKDSLIAAPSVDRDELWYWALLKTLRADMKAEKLYPPGRVYWINSPTLEEDGIQASKPSFVKLDEVDDVEMAFSEIAFATHMFTDQYMQIT